MSLTVSEREHWKERIGARIEKRIGQIKMAGKAVFDSLKVKAREQAIAGLGIGDLETERARLKQQSTGSKNSRSSQPARLSRSFAAWTSRT